MAERYKVVAIHERTDLEAMLNEWWEAGWRLVQLVPIAGMMRYGGTKYLQVVFEARERA